MNSSCDLCEGKFRFYITTCRTCKIPMIVSTDHKAEFSKNERRLIQAMFPGIRIRWRQRKIHDHAHCHLFIREEP